MKLLRKVGSVSLLGSKFARARICCCRGTSSPPTDGGRPNAPSVTAERVAFPRICSVEIVAVLGDRMDCCAFDAAELWNWLASNASVMVAMLLESLTEGVAPVARLGLAATSCVVEVIDCWN